MGLDQYLKAEFKLPAYDELRPTAQTEAARELGALRTLVLNALKLQASTNQMFGMVDVPGTVAIKLDCAYWRKANQIHRWFEQLHGEDLENCQEVQVSLDSLRQLVALCKELLDSRDPADAAKKLPPQAGFFFGSTEIGESYWQDLGETIQQLEPWTQLPEEMEKWLTFTYYAWW
jgi:hypothetical protein